MSNVALCEAMVGTESVPSPSARASNAMSSMQMNNDKKDPADARGAGEDGSAFISPRDFQT